MSETPKNPRKDSAVEKRRDTAGALKKPASRVSLLQKKASSSVVDSSKGQSSEELPQLYLKVECGKDFPQNRTGFMYCTVNLEGLSEQSNYVISSAEPRWNDEFVLHVKQKMSCVEVLFYVVDEEGAETTYLGEVNVPIHTLASHKVLAESFPLSAQSSGTQAQGEVRIVLFNSLQKSSMDALRELEDVYSDFLNLLKGNMPLLASLFDCIDASDADRVGTSVVSIFNFLRSEVELFEWVIRMEVDSTASMSVLFRSNSMAIRLVSLFAKLTASSYLKWLLLPLIEETVAGDCSRFEVDPARLSGAQSSVKKNQRNLQDLVDRFLQAIVSSVERIPRTLRRVCALFVELVEGKFPGGSSRAVGGFFFLRFVCPAIVAPASFGLLQKHPTGASHRALVLVAKVLQNLANMTQFKEAEMEGFNEYLTIKQADVTAFLQNVAAVSASSSEGEVLTAVRPAAVADSCIIIAKLLRQNASRIRTLWEDDEELSGATTLDDLDRVLVELAANEQIHEKPYNASLVEAHLRKEGIIKLQPRAESEASLAHDEDESDILNMSRVWPKPLRPGAAKDMLSLALALYLDECQRASKAKAVDWPSVCGPRGVAHAEFRKLEAAVCELQRADFRHMLSLPQKVAFWLNVYHTLLFHVLFTTGFPGTSHAKKMFYSNFRYRIGSFTLSLADIEHGVLRGNLPNKSGQRQWSDTDKRRQLCLPKEVRVLYALANLTASSPVVVPYGMQVEKQLAGVLTHFLNAVVEIDVVRKEVMLPKQFNRFATDFLAPTSGAATGGASAGAAAWEPNKVLLSWLYNYLTARKKLDILYLQGKTCAVHVARKGGKMMTPKATIEYFSKFDSSGETQPEDLPELFKQGTLRLRTETAPALPASPSTHAAPMLSTMASSPNVSSSHFPTPEPVAEESATSPRALQRTSSSLNPPPPSSPAPPVPVERRMVRQASVLDENIMRESLSTMVQQLTSELYDSQTIAQMIYSQVCRTVSVTTAFNTGKIIREVKVSLLELPGITWTAESLEKFKQNFHLEAPELTRLQCMQVNESKRQQLLKLLNAIQTAVLDIRFLLENVVSFLQKDPSRAVQLSRSIPPIAARLHWVFERVQEKNAEMAPLEELMTLEGAISPEIDSLVSLLALVKDQLQGIDLSNDEGRLSLLAFAAILAWVKTQLDSPKALPPFKPQTWDKRQVEELSAAKLAEITQVLHSLIDSVSRRLVAIRSRLLHEATHEKLLDVASIIRNCRVALLSQ